MYTTVNAYLMLGSLGDASTRECNETNALWFCAFRRTPEIENEYSVLVSRYIVRKSRHV